MLELGCAAVSGMDANALPPWHAAAIVTASTNDRVGCHMLGTWAYDHPSLVRRVQIMWAARVPARQMNSNENGDKHLVGHYCSMLAEPLDQLHGACRKKLNLVIRLDFGLLANPHSDSHNALRHLSFWSSAETCFK